VTVDVAQRNGGFYGKLTLSGKMGIAEDSATVAACAALVGAMSSKQDCGATTYCLSIQQGSRWDGPSEIDAEARKNKGVVTSISVGGAAAHIASGEIEVPLSALVS